MNTTSNTTLTTPPTANTVWIPTNSAATPLTAAPTGRTPQLMSRLAL